MSDLCREAVNVVGGEAWSQVTGFVVTVRDGSIVSVTREDVDSAAVESQIEITRRRVLTSEKTWTDERRSRVEIDVRAAVDQCPKAALRIVE